MEKFKVSGMSCAACSARVEKAVGALSGVEHCEVNLLTGDLSVEGSVTSQQVVEAVTKAGYGIKTALEHENQAVAVSAKQASGTQKQERSLTARLIGSVLVLLMLMYVSMGHGMLNLPLPSLLADNPLNNALLQCTLSLIILIINKKFFVSGAKSAIKLSPNMDTLVALGSGASFIYSFVLLFVISSSVFSGDIDTAHSYLHSLYFESAAMIVTLITIGKLLESVAKGKTTDAIEALIKLSPKTATVLRDGMETVIQSKDMAVGDVFIVRPSEQMPCDGVVISGHTSVDESALTGESIPNEKLKDSNVFAGTHNLTGIIKARATKAPTDTTLSSIIKMVSEASGTKAPIAKIADKVSGVFVPIILVLALITTLIWFAFGESFGTSLTHGIAVLVISCPCALGLATPVAIMVGMGRGAKMGVLFKTATSLEITGKAKMVVLDKTGTVTSGKMKVCDVIALRCTSKEELVKYAYSLEKDSEHPIAKAITEYANKNAFEYEETTGFEIFPGGGLKAEIASDVICGGNLRFMADNLKDTSGLDDMLEKLSEEGKTPVIFSKNNAVLGIIAVSDTIKDDSKEVISKLKDLGIECIMLTGDNENTARAIADMAGISKVIAGVLPGDKERVIRELKKDGKVIMVGDGINDAPALVSADIGIAIGSGTDIAIDSADVVLTNGRLTGLYDAICLSKKVVKNIKENLFWAFFYNALCIPLAAGVFIPIFDISISPMFGALAMSLSSFCVVSNALRLRGFKSK